MGQARQRGSFEQRKQQAKSRRSRNTSWFAGLVVGISLGVAVVYCGIGVFNFLKATMPIIAM